MLSEGRLEFGIGAGYYLPEYSQTGIALPPPRDRVDQLREALAVIKGLWSDGPFTFGGKHYTITDMEGWPKPIQRPHPPIQVGGGGKRMLDLAARRPTPWDHRPVHPGRRSRFGRDTDALVTEKVGWVREASGDRFDQLELAALIRRVVVTDHRRSAAERIAPSRGMTAEQVLASPYFLVGSHRPILEDVQALRERHDISYLTFFPATSTRSRRWLPNSPAGEVSGFLRRLSVRIVRAADAAEHQRAMFVLGRTCPLLASQP